MRRHHPLLIALIASIWIPTIPARASDSGPILYLGTGVSVPGQQDARFADPTAPAPPPNIPQLGGVDFDIEYQDAALAEIGLGYRLLRYLRVELDVNYRNHTLENVRYRPHRGDVHWIAGLANVYGDYPIRFGGDADSLPMLVPYVGAGVGVLHSKAKAEVEVPNRKVRGDSTEFAWNVMFGTAIPIGRLVSFDVGYRYLESLDHSWELQDGALDVGDVNAAYRSHEARVGVRIGY